MPNLTPLEEALEEVSTVFFILDVVLFSLTAVFVFLLGLLFTTLFRLSWMYSFVPTVLYLGIALWYYRKRNNLLQVETHFPFLSEALRTAADTVYTQSNEIIDSLRHDVLKQMKKVKTSSFIDFPSLWLKLASVVLVSFLVVFLAILNVNFSVEFHPELPAVVKALTVRTAGQDVPRVDLSSLEAQNLTGIFGNRSLATLGTKEILLELHPLQSEINLNEQTAVEPKDFQPPQFPKEIYSSSESAYTEKISKKNEALVKSYFEQITR